MIVVYQYMYIDNRFTINFCLWREKEREREILSKEFFVIKNIISRLHEKFRNSVLQFFFSF